MNYQNGAGEQSEVPLEGAVNFRDIGGYAAATGVVRSGLVFRSGSLAQLSPEAIASLRELRIGRIFDLRSAEETLRAPSRIPPGAEYNHRPIVDPARSSRLRVVGILLFQRHKLADLLLEGYTRVMIDANARVIGEIFRTIAYSEDATLIHCTAGKDRTGLTTALLLHTLNVPFETIVTDYLKSNAAYDQYAPKVQNDIRLLRYIGIGMEEMQPFLIAEAKTLELAFDHIRTRYGSIYNYLTTAAGLTEADLSCLKTRLLLPKIPHESQIE